MQPDSELAATADKMTGRFVWTEVKNHLLPIIIAVAVCWFVTHTQQKVIDQLVESNAITAAATTRQAEATEGTNEFLRVNGALPLVEGDGSPASGSPSPTR